MMKCFIFLETCWMHSQTAARVTMKRDRLCFLTFLQNVITTVKKLQNTAQRNRDDTNKRKGMRKVLNTMREFNIYDSVEDYADLMLDSLEQI